MGLVLITIIILAVFFMLMKVLSSMLSKKEEEKKTETECDLDTTPKTHNTECDSDTTLKTHNNENSVDLWMYIVSFLIPIVGIVFGCIQVAKGDKDGARNLFITSIISIVLLAIIYAVRVNKAEKELEDAVKELQDQSSYSYNYDEYEW